MAIRSLQHQKQNTKDCKLKREAGRGKRTISDEVYFRNPGISSRVSGKTPLRDLKETVGHKGEKRKKKDTRSLRKKEKIQLGCKRFRYGRGRKSKKNGAGRETDKEGY